MDLTDIYRKRYGELYNTSSHMPSLTYTHTSLYSICSLYSVQYTLYTIYSVYSVLCTLYSVQCSVLFYTKEPGLKSSYFTPPKYRFKFLSINRTAAPLTFSALASAFALALTPFRPLTAFCGRGMSRRDPLWQRRRR